METICKTCGKTFSIPARRLNPAGNCCSRECRKFGTYKLCEICGESFYTSQTRPDARFCGRKCKGIASRLPKKICPICNKEWQPTFGRANQPTCSRKCGHEYRRRNVGRGSFYKDCEWCSKSFRVTYSTSKVRFCSKDCANRWQGRNKTSHTCKSCGKTFRWSPSRSQRQEPILYCSWACRDADPERRIMLLEMNRVQQLGRLTKPEVIGYGILDVLGVDYEPQHLIGGKFCVDAFIEDRGVVVQFDGDYWHGHPERFPEPDRRQQRRMKLDSSQDAYMKACGYSVIRIWETDLKRKPEAVTARLRQLLAL